MKISNKVKISIPIFVLCFFLVGFSFYSTPQKDKVLIGVLRYILKNWHYEPKDFDDAFSKAVCKDFIDEIDPIKRYFTKEDLADFLKYETFIDDQLKREDLSFYYLVMERFQIRLRESETYYKEILNHKFNFEKKEIIRADYEHLEFAKNKQELFEYWRKQTKLNTLGKIETLLAIEKDKAAEDSTYIKKSFDVIETEAREKSLESLDNFYKRIKELDHTDWFATFVNSIAEEFDPHTTYFAPKVKELFDINMSGKIEGLGCNKKTTTQKS
jgi:carboxyl-terminal processing protease